jgi:TatD DNase family protein
MFIDSHAHIFMLVKEKGASLEDIFNEMIDNQLTSLLNVSGNQEESAFFINELLPFAKEKNLNLFHACGIHPHSSSSFSPDHIDWLKENSLYIDAIGEVGLDLHYNFSPPETQEYVLLKMMDVALELEKPLIIHGRSGEDKIIKILKNRNLQGEKILFHCFTGNKKNADEIIDNGWFISFSGIVTFKKANELAEILKTADLNKILFETDSPFLAPHPFRGKLNTPAKVKYVYLFASELLKINVNDLAYRIEQNFKSFIGI